MTKATVYTISNLRVSPLGAVITHKVRIINDLSSDLEEEESRRGGLNTDTNSEKVPPCLCAEVLPKILQN